MPESLNIPPMSPEQYESTKINIMDVASEEMTAEQESAIKALAEVKAASAIPPRSNKNHCDATFPPSSAWVDPKTKEIKIVLAANDVMDDEYSRLVDVILSYYSFRIC